MIGLLPAGYLRVVNGGFGVPETTGISFAETAIAAPEWWVSFFLLAIYLPRATWLSSLSLSLSSSGSIVRYQYPSLESAFQVVGSHQNVRALPDSVYVGAGATFLNPILVV